MRIALVGVGMVAQTHVDAIQASRKNLSLRGVCARRRTNARAFADKNGGLDVFASIEEITPENTDFVLIATPPNARVPLIDHFCKIGMPILLEKPIERTLAVATEIVEQCEAADIPLGIVFQHRTRDAVATLRDKMEKLGLLALVEIHVPWWRDQSYYDEPGRGTLEQDGGGVLMTQAIHTLDLALSLTDQVARVQAMARTTSLHIMEAEDTVTAGLEFQSGATGTLFATTASFPGGKESITLHGENGVARLEGNALTITWRDGNTEAFGVTEATGGGADPMAFSFGWHQAIIEDFAGALRANRPPLITGREALKAHALIDALIRSSRTGTLTEVAHV